ncbi:MAG: hypothetical protein LCH93_02970 [Proteobacteria bacterium]|nr:hypothetical protein [Pseudomonadota bacterium]
MKDMLDGETKTEFEEIVRRLVRVVDKGSARSSKDERNDDSQSIDQDGSPDADEVAPPPHGEATAGDLPDPPDFNAIEIAARETVASRANLMALIGQLVFSSSNNESLLIYVLMILLQTDEASAAIVFSTLNTTRARLDLVTRLARIKIDDREVRSVLDQLIKDFNETNQVRNEFLHAMYTVDGNGAITHTQTMRLVVKGGKISFGQQHAIDQKRLDGILKTCADLRNLNRRIWDVLPRLQEAVRKASSQGVRSKSSRNAANGLDIDPDSPAG